MEYTHYQDGNFSDAFFLGTLLSIPLWISFFGWIKIAFHFFITL